MARADPLQQLVVAGALIPRIAVALEALQQAAKHESLDQLVAVVQLAEGMQQQLVDVGLLLGQHSEHLEPHGGLVVVGAQQLIELGVAHRMRLVVAGEAGIRGVGAEAG